MAAAGVLPGPVSHLSVAAEERLHRARANRTPHILLRLRQEAEEEEQAVSGVQAAHPLRHPHLPQLSPPVGPRLADTCVELGGGSSERHKFHLCQIALSLLWELVKLSI